MLREYAFLTNQAIPRSNADTADSRPEPTRALRSVLSSAKHPRIVSNTEFKPLLLPGIHAVADSEGTILSGPAREGLALLQGLLLCACCGRALTVRYQG
ncbi:hypothetical protein FJY94_09705, partial [Candidatus Kaiserbacteria bacterium]|nr:hypothetical protein [Candidatus Kaiserbacteria bacterium]